MTGSECGGRSVADLAVPHGIEVDPFTGGVQLRVDVPCKPGRSGFGPALALTYAASAGNSAFGLGWSLSGWPAVGIDTRRQLPAWLGRDDLQLGGDAIVPRLVRIGDAWAPDVRIDGEWEVTTFRSRRGGDRMRVERWRDRDTGRVHFRSWDASGVLTIYGARPGTRTRIADPSDEGCTFAWLPELQLDRYGNAIWIDYSGETLDGVDRAAPYEPSRPITTARYLKRIRYTNSAPLTLTDDVLAGEMPAGLRWHMQVVLDYGDHTGETPAAEPDRVWPARVDAFTDRRAGFALRTYRLCRRILWFHELDELGPGPTLIGALAMEHDERVEGAQVVAIRQHGYRREPGGIAQRTLPPLRMTYAPSDPADAFEAAPGETQDNLSGAAGIERFVDLRGEGLPGILTETGGCWYYKSNLGGGAYGVQTPVRERPAAVSSGFTLGDVDGNGDPELSQLAGRSAGRYEYDRDDQRWRTFRAFDAFPHVEGYSGRAQWIDLNGDGRPDIVVEHVGGLVWFPSQGDAFGSPIEVALPRGIDAVPTVGADPAVRLFFADMTGDGLTDLVRVDNGTVEYWPSLGNGRFGERVVMEGAPRFADGMFDATRLRFVDLDGSGTTDLLYLGEGEVRCWINAAGNRLVPGPRLDGLPWFDTVSTVSVLDFVGDGRPCLVVARPLSTHHTISYLPLTAALRPRLLLEIDDSRGRRTRLAYASSSAHYLRDRDIGQPWKTQLPHHPVVVDRVELIDDVVATRTVRRYEYRDGYFDSTERELRGFGRVDVYDGDVVDEIALGARSVTRTWFHLGTAMWNHHRPTDTYAGDPFVLPLHVIDRPEELAGPDLEDGLRGLAGQMIRQEVWTTSAEHPISVQQRCLQLTRVQPPLGAAPAAFRFLAVEDATAAHEGARGDPRVTHDLVLAIDAYGAPERTASIAYARQESQAGAPAAQAKPRVVVEDHRALSIDRPDRFELDIPFESVRYELSAAAVGSRPVTREQLAAPAVVAALEAPQPHHVELDDGALAARLLSHDRSFYWSTDRTRALPLGEVGAPTLVHHEESACFAPEQIAQVFGARIDDQRLTELGYALRDGLWWQIDATHEMAPAARFSQRVAIVRGDGARSGLEYDDHELAVVATVDPLGNRTHSTIDYHELLPRRIEDPNGAVVEVLRDPLGVIVAETRSGDVEQAPWGFGPLGRSIVDDVDAALADPVTAVGDVAHCTWYDLDAWQRDRAPIRVLTVARDDLVYDGAGGPARRGSVGIAIAYLDGLGRPVQTKTRVEPGDAIQRDAHGAVIVDAGGRPVLAHTEVRWRSSGHVVYDDEQRPSRVHEPFFTPSPAFEGDEVVQHLGVATISHYDAAGRLVAQDLPNGTFATTTYRAWEIERADANDTVLDSTYRALREGLPVDDPERQALEHALGHAGTVETSYLDPAGRTCGSLARAEHAADGRRTELRLDVDGQPREIVDPRGLIAFRYVRDMAGRVLHEHSVDAGERRALPDGYERPLLAWDARGFAIERGFDRADRPTFVDIRGGDGPLPLDHRVEETHYGEDLADRAEAARRNLLGRVASVRDASGQASIGRCDPAGQPLDAERRLRVDDRAEPDWRTDVVLEDARYVSTATYDGRGRPLTDRLPDGTERRYEYLPSGALAGTRVTTPDGVLQDAPIINASSVNARGQLATLRLGNGLEIEYRYDRDTFRLARQLAIRGTRRLQDHRFTYDPAGNLVRFDDQARVVANAAVSSRRDFTYDAHYRLRTATGRVHQALLQHDDVPSTPGTLKHTRHLSLDNGAAIERYTQSYELDVSGNLRSIRHVGASRRWTTEMWIDGGSNRSVPTLDHNGIPIEHPESRFDAAGNLRELDHLRRIAWGHRGTLDAAVLVERAAGTGDDERYVYRADGKRIRKVATRVVHGGGLEVTEKLYLGDQELRRISRNGVVILERWTTHVAAGSQRVALIHRWTRDDLGREVDDITRPRIHYQLSTHQGSSALELDEAGRIISYEEYFPYGGSSLIAGDVIREVARKEYRYSGKERDDATGLYSYGHRYYAPWIGRWLSPDPIGPADDLNLYQFVRGDPIGNTDPDGLETRSRHAGDLVYRHRQPLKETTIESRIAAFRTRLRTDAARAGFDTLTRDDQVRAVTSAGVLVPADPASADLSQWRYISKDDYRNHWQPAREHWAVQQGKPMIVGIWSDNPSSIASLDSRGLSGGDSTAGDSADGGKQGDPWSSAGTFASGAAPDETSAAKPDSGTHATSDAPDGVTGSTAGDQGRTGDGKRGASASRGAGTGATGTGASAGTGRASSGHLAGNEPSASPGDFGGRRGGSADGVVGGTPHSHGMTAGGEGTSLDPRAPLHAPGGNRSGEPLFASGPDSTGRGRSSASGSGAAAHGQVTGPGASIGQGPGGAKQPGSSQHLGAKGVALEIAGILSIAPPKGERGGHDGGIPGGLGLLGLEGSRLQSAYIASSIISFATLALTGGLTELFHGIRWLLTGGLLRLAWRLLLAIPRLLRLGRRALSRLFSAGRTLLGALRGGYAAGRAFSSGFSHTREEILGAFRAMLHTDVSREVLRQIESGTLRVVFLRMRGGGRALSGKIMVNNTMHLEDVLQAIVHEGQHAIDLQRGLIPRIGATASDVAFAELRAFTSAIEFAQTNGLTASAMAEFFRTDVRLVLQAIFDSYEFARVSLGSWIDEAEALRILERYFSSRQ